jgi:type III restriction enzyme
MQRLESFAENEFYSLYENNKRNIAALKEEKRRKYYERLRLASAEPQNIPWALPDSVDFNRSPDAPQYKKHLYLEQDGKFRADLGNWCKRSTLLDEKRPIKLDVNCYKMVLR